jgi:hypothetical protein
MKKIFAIAFALVLTLALAAPALAVSTSVEVTQGGGNLPIVKCKWETPDDVPGPGTQIYPPGVFEGTREVTIWVVVGDIEDAGVVPQVLADVYHPEGPPLCGSIKYDNYQLTMVDRLSEGIPEFEAAAAADIVTYQTDIPYEDVIFQLEEGVAQVYKVTIILHYCQPAGMYRVEVRATDTHGNTSDPMINWFEYIGVAAVELDFTTVTYPAVMISSHVWTLGDRTFGTSDRPTVRNVGNTDCALTIEQDDMGFGQYGDTGEWKVEYDARMGNDTGGNTIYYDPYCPGTLPDTLLMCHEDKLDFSIHVKAASTGSYTGTLTITPSVVAFEGDCSD